MASGVVGVFPPFVRFAITFLLFTLVIGELVGTRLLHLFGTSVQTLPFAALIGVSAQAIVAWILSVGGMSFTHYVAAVQLLACALFAGLLIGGRPAKRPVVSPKTGHPRLESMILLTVALAVAVSFSLYPRSIGYESDAYDHIGYIRAVASEDCLQPDGVLATDRDAPFTAKSDPRKGFFHPFLAAVAVLAGLEPYEVWRWLPSVLAPIAILMFWGFARSLLPGVLYAAVAMVLFLLFRGGDARDFFGTIAYGQRFGLIWFWGLVVLTLHYTARPTHRRLIAILLLAVGGSVVHFGVWIHFVLLAVSAVLFRGWMRMDLRAWFRFAMSAAFCGLAVLAWKLAVSQASANALHTHPQGLLYMGEVGASRFIASPVEVIKREGLLFFAGAIMIPGLVFVRRHRRHGRVLLALCIPPILVSMNPFLAPAAYARGAYLIHRVLLNVPAFVVTALILGSVVMWARRGHLVGKVAAFGVLFLWAKLFLVGMGAWAAHSRAVADGAGFDARPVEEFFRREVAPGSVVLSDPVTSYRLSAFTDVRVVAVLHQHGDPTDTAAFARLSAVRSVLSPFSTASEALVALQRFAVDYVVVNGAFRDPVRSFLAEWDQDAAAVLEPKIRAMRAALNRVYDAGGIQVYRVRPEGPEALSWHPSFPFRRGRPDSFSGCAGDGRGPVRILGVAVDPPEALPGETVRLTVGYRRSGRSVTGLPLRLSVRLDHHEYFAGTTPYPGEKYVRRYRERRSGVFHRYRLDHHPFRGRFEPDAWPIEKDIFETFPLTLPANLAAGVYDVELRLGFDTLVPNFSVRDLLYNEDSYTAMPCAELRVSHFVTR